MLGLAKNETKINSEYIPHLYRGFWIMQRRTSKIRS